MKDHVRAMSGSRPELWSEIRDCLHAIRIMKESLDHCEMQIKSTRTSLNTIYGQLKILADEVHSMRSQGQEPDKEGMLEKRAEMRQALLHRRTNTEELQRHLREYLDVMATEPAEELIPVKNVYHDLRRMLGDEE